jgi:hypothetical protein
VKALFDPVPTEGAGAAVTDAMVAEWRTRAIQDLEEKAKTRLDHLRHIGRNALRKWITLNASAHYASQVKLHLAVSHIYRIMAFVSNRGPN